MSGDDAHLRALGQRILSEANDLKRTPAALANELGIHFDTIMAVIKGDRDKMTTRNVIDAMVDTYPVAMADLWIEPDDTDDGVRLMSAADSAASKRVVERLDRTGGLSPYYEYRDTATSASAPFKPEWIEELRQVGDACADNPDVAYNKGHLLHQTTFFIGPVNFYWRSGGSSHCAELNTGDSNYISPFVPHSFASRDPNRRGLIVAVTFAGQVHRATADIGRMGAQAAASLAGDLRDATAQARRLRRHVDAECLSVTNFSHLIAERGIHANRVAALLDGAQPNGQECDVMADVLNVRAKDLMVASLAPGEDVIVKNQKDGGWRPYPDAHSCTYELMELARSRQQPLMKGFAVKVHAREGALLRHGLHESTCTTMASGQ